MIEDYKNNSRKEAELILREAELKAEAIVKEAQEKVVKIHEDIVDLKGVRRHFKEELKRLIDSHTRMLEFDAEREAEGAVEGAEAGARGEDIEV
jgi:cell division initiation protein